MITFFTTPKPFLGHIELIQRNAIWSWLHLGTECEIILLGDDEGVGAFAKESGVTHIPDIGRNRYGTPLVNSIFELAEKNARSEMLCYINSDIILFKDFTQALSKIRLNNFLLLGQRWNLDVIQEIDYSDPNWESIWKMKAHSSGQLNGPDGVDYYTYRRGLWGQMPPFALGRTRYDNWMIWKARDQGVRVIDATGVITCIHQNHERTYTSIGIAPPRGDVNDLTKSTEAQENHELAGGWDHIFTLRDATWRLTKNGLKPNVGMKTIHRRLEAEAILHPHFGIVYKLAKRVTNKLKRTIGLHNITQ
jgi:hypothetical protein